MDDLSLWTATSLIKWENREKEHWKVCFQRDKLDVVDKWGIHCSRGTQERKFISWQQTLPETTEETGLQAVLSKSASISPNRLLVFACLDFLLEKALACLPCPRSISQKALLFHSSGVTTASYLKNCKTKINSGWMPAHGGVNDKLRRCKTTKNKDSLYVSCLFLMSSAQYERILKSWDGFIFLQACLGYDQKRKFHLNWSRENCCLTWS